jgi:hypothetical protein
MIGKTSSPPLTPLQSLPNAGVNHTALHPGKSGDADGTLTRVTIHLAICYGGSHGASHLFIFKYLAALPLMQLLSASEELADRKDARCVPGSVTMHDKSAATPMIMTFLLGQGQTFISSETRSRVARDPTRQDMPGP